MKGAENGVRQDEAEIRKVHFKYGYYLDKCLYKEVSLDSPYSSPLPKIDLFMTLQR
jgi:hypothetical protein